MTVPVVPDPAPTTSVIESPATNPGPDKILNRPTYTPV